MTANRTRAGPSGLVRPCSQFFKVAGWNPNFAANWDWLSRSFRRTARTLVEGTLTFVMRTGIVPPPAHAIASFKLAMTSWPTLVLVVSLFDETRFFITSYPWRRSSREAG